MGKLKLINLLYIFAYYPHYYTISMRNITHFTFHKVFILAIIGNKQFAIYNFTISVVDCQAKTVYIFIFLTMKENIMKFIFLCINFIITDIHMHRNF